MKPGGSGGLDYFHMYKPENFLSYANAYLKAEVSTEAIEEVRDLSKERQVANIRHDEYVRSMLQAESSVFQWLTSRFESVEQNTIGFPDFIATMRGRRFGFEVRLYRGLNSVVNRLRDIAYRAHYLITEGRLDIVTIILVAESDEIFDFDNLNRLRARLVDMPDRVRLLLGKLSGNEREAQFVPVREFDLAGNSPVGEFGPIG